jgi:hypothetical protein
MKNIYMILLSCRMNAISFIFFLADFRSDSNINDIPNRSIIAIFLQWVYDGAPRLCARATMAEYLGWCSLPMQAGFVSLILFHLKLSGSMEWINVSHLIYLLICCFVRVIFANWSWHRCAGCWICCTGVCSIVVDCATCRAVVVSFASACGWWKGCPHPASACFCCVHMFEAITDRSLKDMILPVSCATATCRSWSCSKDAPDDNESQRRR